MRVLLEGSQEGEFRETWEKGRFGGSAGQGDRLIVPSGPADLAAHYDLTLSRPAVSMDSFAAFDRWLAQAAARRGLSCALLHDGVVHEAIRRLGQGRLTIHYHLDYYALWHRADDPYARLSEAVRDAGGRPVNPPGRARIFTDKANAHAALLRQGLGVPQTLLIRPGEADRHLTGAERAQLRLHEPGVRLYLKPANGFGHRGVVRTDRTDPDGLLAALAAVRNYDRNDTVLIQREVRCPKVLCDDGVERPAYWRVLYCLGDVIPFWWTKSDGNLARPSYRRMTGGECRRHGLWPLFAFTQALADFSGLEWFSTELCLSDGSEASRSSIRCRARDADGNERDVLRPVVAIDYLNDQCDVDVQSRWPGAPPDGVVRHVAERFAAAGERETRTAKRQAVMVPRRKAA